MLKPLNGKIVLRVKKQNETATGIVLTNSLDTSSLVATVIAVSNYCDKDGNVLNSQIKVGDTVIISKFAGSQIEYEKEEYLVLDIDDILAIIKEDM